MAGLHPTLSKYRLLARLGSGGMADVYLAMADNSGAFQKLQVLKVMRSDLSDQDRPDFLQMFQDEARLAARLNHPNIVQSHEVGFEDGQPFIVMEYLDGQTLSRVQQRAWRNQRIGFPLEMQLFVLCQVLEGLEYAHALTDYDDSPLHIVHRDVSPQNVFITYAGHTKLVDFGIAKTLESSKTRAGVVKGKVAYMAPEQVTAAGVDNRVDIFGVGVMLWEAIAGRGMHADLSVYQAMNRLVVGNLPSIREAVPEVAPQLEEIVSRALAPKREDRYPDAASFRAELVAYLEESRQVRAREVGERVAQLFASERAEINRVIRRAMTGHAHPEAETDGKGSTRMLPALPGSAASRTSAPPTASQPPLATEAPTALAPHTPPASSEPRATPLVPPPSRRKRIAGAVLVAAIAVAALLLFSRRDADDRAAAAWGTPEVSQPEPAAIDVQIRVRPGSAAMILDGRKLASNPYQAQHPRDDQEHLLVVTAPGYTPRAVDLSFDQDLRLDLQLEAVDSLAVASEDRPEPSARPPLAPAPRVNEVPAALKARHEAKPQRVETPRQALDPYRDFPQPRRATTAAPLLDTSDPWVDSQPGH